MITRDWRREVGVMIRVKRSYAGTQLRLRFAHRVKCREVFRRRYGKELNKQPDIWASIVDTSSRRTMRLPACVEECFTGGLSRKVALRRARVTTAERPRSNLREKSACCLWPPNREATP